MNLQYLSDSEGKTTGVFIPIEEWNYLKAKYKDIEQEDVTIPDLHKKIVRERMADYKINPDSAINFDTAIDDIEKDL